VVYVTGILFSLTSRGCSLKEVEALNEDEGLKGFLGIERFPDESSAGEWLRNVGEERVEAVRRKRCLSGTISKRRWSGGSARC
jgi:hypothetical protein